MKKALVLGLLCVLVGCSDPTGGGKLTITKHGNGKTASRGYMLNDHIKVGDWVYFFEDGQKEKQGSYLEDQMHGTWTFWLPGGSESWTAEYTNGDGSKNGRFALTSDEIRDLIVQEGKANGASEEDIADFVQSGGWPHSAVRFYRLGLEHGPYVSVNKSDQKSEERTYKNGKLEGVWTEWHDNGQKRMGGTWQNGNKEGVWTYWDENGQKRVEGTWQNGKMEGVWTYWDENGQKKAEGTYKDGTKEGVWTYWDKQGNVTKTETYKNGKLVK